MKKLMFATALVASAAAFADPLNAISFEGYSAGGTFANGATEVGEDGNDKSSGPFFYYEGEQDGSSVKTFGGENAATPDITRPAAFATATPNLNYLDLSTEGGILWRSINPISRNTSGETTTYDLGNAADVVADGLYDGLYLDTLVQFTPTEDGGAPELGDEDKLAIWLNVDSSVTPPATNLMVRAGSYDDQGTLVTNQTFVLVGTGVQIVPGEWCRLTVKAVDNILPSADVYKIPGFMVFINGKEMAATTSPLDAEFLASLRQAEILDADQVTALASGKFLPSLLAGDPEVTSTLQGVGFKGSGALDDLVWTTEDPFANAGGDDYKVTIGGSDVVVTPSAEDLAAVQAAVIAGGGQLDVTDVDAVNAALAAEIGSTGIPSWQAIFLGLPPTEAGLESFKIDSISFNEDGQIVVTLPSTVDPKTGRGVNITIKLKAADTPNAAAADWTDVESASGTAFAPFAPGSTDTKKFYKVVVEFAAPAASGD